MSGEGEPKKKKVVSKGAIVSKKAKVPLVVEEE
jgi:hypothetical protein